MQSIELWSSQVDKNKGRSHIPSDCTFCFKLNLEVTAIQELIVITNKFKTNEERYKDLSIFIYVKDRPWIQTTIETIGIWNDLGTVFKNHHKIFEIN